MEAHQSHPMACAAIGWLASTAASAAACSCRRDSCGRDAGGRQSSGTVAETTTARRWPPRQEVVFTLAAWKATGSRRAAIASGSRHLLRWLCGLGTPSPCKSQVKCSMAGILRGWNTLRQHFAFGLSAISSWQPTHSSSRHEKFIIRFPLRN